MAAKGKQHPTNKPDQQKIIQIVAVAVIAIVAIALIAYAIFSQLQKTAGQNGPHVFTYSGETPKLIGDKQYESVPPMIIDVNKKYTAVVKMAKGGEFKIEFYPDKAPITVNNFVFLASQGYYDGVTFHRVLEGFMAQTGDPTGSGSGDPGYQFANEDSDLSFDKPGVVAMANSGRDTNGSQFFILFEMQPHLDGGYTIFGQVTEGMDVVNGITRRDPNMNPDFVGDAIQTITIYEE